MCGRYDLSETGRTLRIGDVLLTLTTSHPRYNVSPLQRAPIVRRVAGQLQIQDLRWGLIPGWAKDATLAAKCINARGETVAEKPAFRTAFRRRRCVVPADGYFEWQKVATQKLPWRFVRRDRQPFLFAGLWETWQPPEAPETPLETFTILTTEPNPVAAEVHDRMPVILGPETAATWLEPETTPEALRALLGPAGADVLERYRVSTFVNTSRNDGPECVAKAAIPS